MGNEYILEMKDITKTFPGVKALDHVTLRVRPGTVHSLMGENGAGKSTLMNCLFGIYSLDEGEIILDGRKVSFENPNNMKVGALYFWSDEEDGYIEFMYDKIEGILVLSEDESTSSSEAKNRYLVLYEDSYYYNFRIK